MSTAIPSNPIQQAGFNNPNQKNLLFVEKYLKNGMEDYYLYKIKTMSAENIFDGKMYIDEQETILVKEQKVVELGNSFTKHQYKAF